MSIWNGATIQRSTQRCPWPERRWRFVPSLYTLCRSQLRKGNHRCLFTKVQGFKAFPRLQRLSSFHPRKVTFNFSLDLAQEDANGNTIYVSGSIAHFFRLKMNLIQMLVLEYELIKNIKSMLFVNTWIYLKVPNLQPLIDPFQRQS